ncbi:MAG: hypothetical protein II295_07450 [Akkermansia sp.]|nr:hypothetical protein [Akkermansia sp.]
MKNYVPVRILSQMEIEMQVAIGDLSGNCRKMSLFWVKKWKFYLAKLPDKDKKEGVSD